MLIAGVDEAGRGPIAGDVFAAAVILNTDDLIDGLDDSKKLCASRRSELDVQIKNRSIAWNIEQISVRVIDEINILQASLLAMKNAVEGLGQEIDLVRVDGCHKIAVNCTCESIVRGDQIHQEIAAASILAKVARDRYMSELAERFPGYGFERHKGYPTVHHLQALNTLGITKFHRRSFGPIKSMIRQ
ncbi:MAG: ribonuclease HII [Gammaproteobacteria bacterium]|nr:ribonuclease HII [Gammaproteobacteria bacterium]MCY4217770.1 ribonuclease HII [Gammaproteobacteria bacterium]MCY4274469.1 ribonuclease HII [Gammaproteobacteria bacterium]